MKPELSIVEAIDLAVADRSRAWTERLAAAPRVNKKRTAARVASQILYAVAVNPGGGDVTVTVFESRRCVSTIQLTPVLALQMAALLTEAATGRRDQ